jgi:hypothetical protein
MVRDVLVREIPTVLRTDIYALAALIGATVIVGARSLEWARALSTSRRTWHHCSAPSFVSEFAWGPCVTAGGFRPPRRPDNPPQKANFQRRQ